jgi:methyltransferase FkbM-like protein
MARGALTRRVLEQRLWGEEPFSLFDVGCSGGIDRRWKSFGERLLAVGFDPLVAEIDRLNVDNTHPGIRYEAAFVSCRDFDRLFPPASRNDRIVSKNNDPFPRVSAAAAQSRLATSYVQQEFNAGADIVLSKRSIVLDDYVDVDRHERVDFVKIDTDGHDIEVVLGAEAIMSAGGILGLYVEAQFHGSTHDYANTFSNIDRFLRRHGFTLFDLPAYRYSRSALPAPFVYDLAAQTTSGQILSGDALYLRDLGALDYERMWPYNVTRERIIKLACLFDLFDLPDCAAELLINRATVLDPAVRDGLLDQLVSGAPGSYAAHVAAFEDDFASFYPSRMKRQEHAGLSEPAKTALTDDPLRSQRLHERIERLVRKNEALRERVKSRDHQLDRMAKRVEELKAKRQRSTSR